MMRSLKLSLPVLLLLLFVASCAVDPDEDDIDYVSEYTGSWDVQETEGIHAPQTYRITISRGDSENEIIINDLYNVSGTRVRAMVNGFNLAIPQQASNGISFNGSGSATADFDQVTLYFTANDGAGNDQVTAVLTPF